MKPSFLLVLFAFAAQARAVLLHSHRPLYRECEEILVSQVKLVPSGREGTDWPRFEKIVTEYLKKDGIFEQLNISIPWQTLQFMPGGDLNAIVSVNGFPVAHWYDGQQLAQANRKKGMVYELVIGGEREHFGFYRDDNSFKEQLSIFFHATAGHNHFSHNSRYPHFRSSDRIQEAVELSDYLDQARIEVGSEEVSKWYQYLLSSRYAQDFVSAVYQKPEDLKLQAPRKNSRGKFERPGFQPTRNVLQAFIGNLNADLPEWKREIARRFERLQRFMPGMVGTKIMNEGIAVLMQIILPKHGGLNTIEDGIEYCCLLHGVVRKDLRNPYYLGLEAAKNIYNRFLRRPEIARLPTWIMKDAAFISYLTKEIIGVMNDEMFLNFALDDEWINKQNLNLVRPWTKEEMRAAARTGNIPPNFDPKKPNENWPYSILTRDPASIRRALIAQNKTQLFSMPSPHMMSLNEGGNGNVALELKDQVGRRVALDRRTIPTTLYVLAQIKEAPVSLESTFDIPDTQAPRVEYTGYIGQVEEKPKLQKKRIKVLVTPGGDVRVFEVKRGDSSGPESVPEHNGNFGSALLIPELTEVPGLASELKNTLDQFRYTLNLGQAAPDAFYSAKFQVKMVDETVDAIVTGPSVNLQLNVPTAARALSEYQDALASRLSAALKDAIQGRGKLVRGLDGVSLAALPSIPWLQFDQESLNREMSEQPARPLPVMRQDLAQLNLVSPAFLQGDFDHITDAPGSEGDVFWGPEPKGGGGDGGDGSKPGEDSGEEMMEKISLKDYAEALAQDIQLPNLRPKAGLDTRKDEVPGGRRNRTSGRPVTRVIQRNAFRRGLQEALGKSKEEGEDVFHADPLAVMSRGVSLLRREQDWSVRAFEPKRAPDVSAVVYYIMDTSGSMDPYHSTAKQAFYDLRALLGQRYKHLKFKFITMNDKAYVYDDFDKFLAFKPNGGTRYAHAFRKAEELFPEHPSGQYDRFVVVAGDMDETMTAEEASTFTSMKQGLQFAAILKVHDQANTPWGAQLTNFFRSQAENDPYVGFAEIIPQASYSPLIFKKLFKNPE